VQDRGILDLPGAGTMTIAASIALLSAGIACFVAVLSGLFARAPGWRDQRQFALAASAVAVYSALNIPTAAAWLPDGAVVICSRLQIAASALHGAVWLHYSTRVSGGKQRRLDGILAALLAVLAAAGAFTPWLVPGGVRTHTVEALGTVYRSARMTLAGDLTWAFQLAVLAVPIARLARAQRRGVPSAGVFCLALLLLVAMGVNDALVASGAYDGPYLVDLGFLMPMAAVGYALTARFVSDARALAELRKELEAQVAQRTAELSRTQETLHRTEKLAALGQFAAGVAHEVNNPSAVLSANLQYLSDNEGEVLSPSGRDAVRDSLVSVRRISAIVRQLLDAGRLAASSTPSLSLPARALADDAVSVARARAGRRHGVQNQLPEGLWVLGQESVLVQVLVNLVVNALQAIPEHRSDGMVVVRSEGAGGRVLLVVEDNGPGMVPEVLRRAFEPFFSTKPFGSGTGLGLAVSRGLVAGMGGELRLSSEVGVGTRALVELPPGAPPAPAVPPPAVADAPRGPRLQLLVVDDEPAVLASLRRLLESRYGVEVAADVDAGLEHLAGRDYDLVLCDVMMPGGGGERLFRTLRERSPSAARRVVFLTGGAITEGARKFLHDQPQPVLYKPLELQDLEAAAERIRAAS